MDEKERELTAEEAQEVKAEEGSEPEQAKKPAKKKNDKASKLQKQVDSLTEELNKANEKADEAHNDYLRARADYENLKRRTETSNSQFYADGIAKAVLEILPVIDNLERALDAEKEDTSMKQGVMLVYKQAMTSLSKLGVEEIAAQGEPFDPNFHNAIMQVPAEEGEESGVVKTVLMKGYKMDSRVIRHSMVQVTE